jgi:hypothetical protein
MTRGPVAPWCRRACAPRGSSRRRRHPQTPMSPRAAAETHAPSSFVQTITSIGAAVSTFASFNARTTSRPASTPYAPSNLPPCGCVSRWLPVATGRRCRSRPARRA